MTLLPGSGSPARIRHPDVRRRSRFRRCLFILLSFGLAYLVIEVFAWGLLQWGGGLREVQRARASAATGVEGTIDTRFEVVHPFLGYVMHVDNADYHVQGAKPYVVNDFGLYDAAPPLRRRSPDRLLVAVTGGSVAHQFSVLSADELAAELAVAYPGRTIEFVRLGVPGYKQPQQLMILAYILTLGGELDVLINLDGFNEIALPAGENVPNGVFAAFPRSWQYRVVTGNDFSVMRAIGQVAYCRSRRTEISRQMAPFQWSPCAMLIWTARISRADEELSVALREASQLSATDAGFCASGPHQKFASDAEMLSHLAQIWADSSLQMHRLCLVNQIDYYHFLQPTRHFPTIDRQDDSRPGDDYIPPVIQAGYPLLQEQGATLREQGVAFTDLTATFPPLQAGIYVDFCHLNKQANDQLAKVIGTTIAEHRLRRH